MVAVVPLKTESHRATEGTKLELVTRGRLRKTTTPAITKL